MAEANAFSVGEVVITGNEGACDSERWILLDGFELLTLLLDDFELLALLVEEVLSLVESLLANLFFLEEDEARTTGSWSLPNKKRTAAKENAHEIFMVVLNDSNEGPSWIDSIEMIQKYKQTRKMKEKSNNERFKKWYRKPSNSFYKPPNSFYKNR